MNENYGLGRMQKEAAIVYLRHCPRILLKVLRKENKSLSQACVPKIETLSNRI
jgi:hypothetical protein